MYTLYLLETPYARGGVLVEPNTRRIVAAPPIYHTFRHRNFDTIVARLRRRGWLRAVKELRNE